MATWRQMRTLHVPVAQEPLEGLLASCTAREEYESAFGLFLLALESGLQPLPAVCVPLLRACAKSSAWALSAFAVLTSLRGAGAWVERPVYMQLAETLTMMEEFGRARDVVAWADVDAQQSSTSGSR